MFSRKCSTIGMLHLRPLPGAAGFDGNVETIMDIALREAVLYKDAGFDSLLLENMHDVPFLKGRVEPETSAAMAVISAAVKKETGLPVGIQILAAANIEALGVAVAASLDYIRVEAFVFAHVADEGYIEASAPELIRRRWNLKSEHIQIFADIKKKHSAHAITGDISLADTAKAAEFFKADGVIVTGMHTGDAPDSVELQAVRKSVGCRVLAGSGVSAENVQQYLPNCDGLIVGSSLKKDGKWDNELDKDRVKRFIEACRKAEAQFLV